MTNLKGYQNTHLKCILEGTAHLKLNTFNKLQDCVRVPSETMDQDLALGLVQWDLTSLLILRLRKRVVVLVLVM